MDCKVDDGQINEVWDLNVGSELSWFKYFHGNAKLAFGSKNILDPIIIHKQPAVTNYFSVVQSKAQVERFNHHVTFIVT